MIDACVEKRKKARAFKFKNVNPARSTQTEEPITLSIYLWPAHF